MTRRIGPLAAAFAVLSTAMALVVLASTSAFGQTLSVGDGVRLKVESATIPADLKPVVTFRVTDVKGTPLRLADLDANSPRFAIAAIQVDPATNLTRYVNYVVNAVTGTTFQFRGETRKAALASATQAGADSGGAFADLGGGRFTYTFKTAAPSTFDTHATHTVGAYATRNNRASVSNDVFSFVPAGGPVEVQRQVVTTEACNGCHDNLAAHGGTRRDTALCVLCHTAQTVDQNSGNSLEFDSLIHKLHSGANLPSVKAGQPFFIGSDRNDFSDIVWPQDTRNCQTCHKGGAQSDNFKTSPSAAACGACHDDVNLGPGATHGGTTLAASTSCAGCHPADGQEFDRSVTGAHTIPTKSKQLKGVNFTIVSFTDTKPGRSPTVVFTIKDNAGQPIAPSEMASLSLVLAGPTTDFANAVSENAVRAVPTADGNFSYTFAARIPDDAAGTYAVGIQGARAQQVTTPSGPLAVSDFGFNTVAYGAVTDPVPLPPKQVVDLNKCNQCHETLALHGGGRRNTEFCVLCHNPNMTDVDKRTQAGGPLPPESVVFRRLIHKIHTGEEQQDKPFVIYGGPPANPGPVTLSEARFPTDRQNCAKCHVANSNLLTFMPARLPTTVKVGDTVVSQTGPIQTACIGCHDGKPAKAHAETMTASSGEACRVCHNENRDFAVSQVHAIR